MTHVTIHSGEGEFTYVLETACPVTDGVMARVDFSEYAAFYGLIEGTGAFPSDFHICDVTSWSDSGEYMPAEIDFRCEYLLGLLNDRFEGAPGAALHNPLMTLPATSHAEELF